MRGKSNNVVQFNEQKKMDLNNLASAPGSSALNSELRPNDQCQCCPYGYHIDLDFVRYCEQMANGAYLKQLKQLRRSRRKQRKSMEALLSYHEEQQRKLDGTGEVLVEEQNGGDECVDDASKRASGPPPDLVNTSDALRDALREAMLDFEETFEKSSTLSRNRKSSDTVGSLSISGYYSEDSPRYMSKSMTGPPGIDLLNHSTQRSVASTSSTPQSTLLSPTSPRSFRRKGGFATLHDTYPPPHPPDYPLAASRSRSGSASSLTSVSTVSSFVDHLPPQPSSNVGSKQMADTMATLSLSLHPPTHLHMSPASPPSPTGSTKSIVSMNKNTLQSIREQMAASLQRMRELEEHVKSIPILQVKLSVLKEEKRLLMLQLKANKVTKLDQRSIAVGSPPPSLPKDGLPWDQRFEDMDIEEMRTRLDRLGATGIATPRRRHHRAGSRSRSMSPTSRQHLINLRDFHSHQRAVAMMDLGDCEGASLEDLRDPQGFTKTELYLKETRSIGVCCSVLTRDVAVNHVGYGSKSVGVGSDVSLTPMPMNCQDCEARKTIDDLKIHHVPSPCPECLIRSTRSTMSRSVNTDVTGVKDDQPKLSMVVSQVESILPQPCVDCQNRKLRDRETKNAEMVEKASWKSHQRDVAVNTFNLPTYSQGTSTPPPLKVRRSHQYVSTDLAMDDVISREEYDVMVAMTTDKLELAPETKTVNVQTDCKVDHALIQVDLSQFGLKAVPKETRDLGIMVNTVESKGKPKMIDRSSGDRQSVFDKILCDNCRSANPRRSIGVGRDTINDVLCDRCGSIKTRSIGVGEPIMNNTCSKCIQTVSVVTKSTGSGISSVNDRYCDRCDNLKTVNIAVGDDAIDDYVCVRCANRKVSNVGTSMTSSLTSLMKSAGTNTDLTPNGGDVKVCDKCNVVITNMATTIVTSTPQQQQQQPPPIPSRIPRLSSSSSMTTEVHSATTTMETIQVSSKTTTTKSSSSSTVTGQGRQSVYHRRELLGGDGRVDSEGFVNQCFAEQLSSPSKSSVSAVESNGGRLSNRQTTSGGQPDNRNENENRESSSDSSDDSDSDDSDDSPDEGSYDSIHGNIVHTCHDDEAIRQGLPGAAMFQPIMDRPRTKYLLSPDVLTACKILNDHLKKPALVASKRLNSSVNLIQQEWFRVSSQKGADPHLVEDYMDAFEDLSRELLDRVVNMSDASGNTAIHYSVSHGNFDVVSLLLDSKVCDITKQNKAGYSCLMLASLAHIRGESDRNVLHRLFQLGDVNLKAAQHGQTALMLAVSHGRLDVVKMLVENGADINIQDDDGSTALMCASEHGHIDIVRYLLSHPDCDPNLKDNDNSTALSIAMEAGNKDIGVLIYATTNLSRGTSPYSSLRGKKRSTTPSLTASTPPRTPPPPSPASSRKSTTSVP